MKIQIILKNPNYLEEDIPKTTETILNRQVFAIN